jgi:hypothetical protein
MMRVKYLAVDGEPNWNANFASETPAPLPVLSAFIEALAHVKAQYDVNDEDYAACFAPRRRRFLDPHPVPAPLLDLVEVAAMRDQRFVERSSHGARRAGDELLSRQWPHLRSNTVARSAPPMVTRWMSKSPVITPVNTRSDAVTSVDEKFGLR